ncbi:MAG: dynamin family protein [Syntrophobacteraceae bacterium]|nr:dynamin family protein [Desulfobacteraceae bacterium]
MPQESGEAQASGERLQSIAQFVRLRNELLSLMSGLPVLDPRFEKTCPELGEKLERNTFNLVVVGQFKRGKTCLINALLGSDILPVAVVPLTSIVTVLTYGEELTLEVFFTDGRASRIAPGELADYVTETGNPKNVRNVRDVLITFPSAYLKDGVRLIDTPGVGSVYSHNTDVAYQYLPKADAALFLLSVDQPASRAELDFLRDVREYSGRIFFLLNKIDYLNDLEVEESIEFSRKSLREAVGADVNVFPVSAKLALCGKMEGCEASLRESRLPQFSEVLHRFLVQEKGKVLILSVAGSLLRALSHIRLEAELELRSLTSPVEEIRRKVEALESKNREIASEKEHFDLLLNGEVERIVKTVLDPDLRAFRKDIGADMARRFDAFYAENEEKALRELNEVLEGFVTGEVERAFSEWHEAEEEKISSEFDGACGPFLEKINDIVDDLHSFSSRLFSVPFESVRGESTWKTESRFYFRLGEEPVGLDLLADSLAQVLPGYIARRFEKIRAFAHRVANRWIVDKRRRRMNEAIEMHAGRMRHDFVERLQRSKLAFRSEMMGRIEATADGIGRALEKGMAERAKGEAEAARRQESLLETLGRIREEEKELERIRADATDGRDAS